jgi:MoxR-like ATPase
MLEKEVFTDRIRRHQLHIQEAKKELGKAVIGQQKVLDGFFRALISNGHVLVEGVPGIAKTLTVRALSAVTHCSFSRIQFTADLLPTDITGITTFEEGKGFYTLKGPIFANFVLADEINRAPPKVQSALLEAMQEKQVTIGKETFQLPRPFFVLATQNPIESLGTYPLPEAQVDRFLFKLFMDYPSIDDEKRVISNNMTLQHFEEFRLKPVITPQRLIEIHSDVKRIFLNDKIENYIVKLIDASRHADKYNVKHAKYIEWGSSPRGSIGLFIASKAEALMKGKSFVTPQDVKEVAHDVLRHRIILNYEGQAEGITPEMVIDDILSKVPVS